MLALLTAGVTGVAMAAAVIPSRRRRSNGTAAPEVELLPQPRLVEPSRRSLAVTLLVLWGAGVVLPLVQLAFSAEEQRSQAASARLAVLVTTDLAVGTTRSAFDLDMQRLPLELQAKATARRYAALDTPMSANAEEAVARAEERATHDATAIGRRMARSPLPSDGLERRAVQALTTDALGEHPLAVRQQAETHRADRFGGWSNGVVVLIAVVLAVEAALQIRDRPPHP